MKRLLILLCVVGFLTALPLSHVAVAKKPKPVKVEICHATDSVELPGIGFITGHVISVSENALDAHLAHGDAELYFPIDEFSIFVEQLGLNTVGADCFGVILQIP